MVEHIILHKKYLNATIRFYTEWIYDLAISFYDNPFVTACVLLFSFKLMRLTSIKTEIRSKVSGDNFKKIERMVLEFQVWDQQESILNIKKKIIFKKVPTRSSKLEMISS